MMKEKIIAPKKANKPAIIDILSTIKHPKLMGALFIIVAHVLAAIFIMFYLITWPQSAFWPYRYDDNAGPQLGFIIFVGGILIIIIVYLIFMYFGIDLLSGSIPFPRVKMSVKKFLIVFLKIAFIISIGASGIMGAVAIDKSPYRFSNLGPYLTWMPGQNPSTGICICWYSSISTISLVFLGESPDNLNRNYTSEDNGRFHKVRIDGLKPDTRYYYRIYGQNFGLKSFRTAPANYSNFNNFTIALYADPRTNNGISSIKNEDENGKYGENLPPYIIRHLREENKLDQFAFSIIAGDIVGRGVEYESWWLWLKDIASDDFASNYSHIVAVGNHEHYDDPMLTNMKKYYPYTSFNYSIIWGPLFVLVLDTYDYEKRQWEDVQFSPQLKEWAMNELEIHKDYPFKIIAIHESPINHGQFSKGGFHGNISEAILDMCNKYDVDMVFSGHTHDYEVWQLNNTIFLKAGIGGNSNRGYYYYDNSTLSEVEKAGGIFLDGGGDVTGWIQIDFSKDQMHIRPQLINGTELRTFTIEA